MRLTSKGRYAVMALADLGRSAGAAPLHEIAARQGISLAYLEQLFARLRRAGLVEGVRGPHGGYRLSRAAEEISVSDIIAAVNERVPTTRCVPGQTVGCTGRSERCLTHDLWAALGRRIEAFLVETSLADVVAGRLDAPQGEAA